MSKFKVIDGGIDDKKVCSIGRAFTSPNLHVVEPKPLVQAAIKENPKFSGVQPAVYMKTIYEYLSPEEARELFILRFGPELFYQTLQELGMRDYLTIEDQTSERK